jgi:hypothetical protein
MTQELTRRPVTRYSAMPTAARFQYAQTLSGAADMIPRGLFDKSTGKPSPAKIFLVLEIGATLGLEPSAAMQGIDVIEGKAAISPQLMTGLIRNAGHKLRIVETGEIETGDYKVTVNLTRSDDPDETISASWTPKQAARAGLCTYAPDTNGEWHVKARADSGKILPWEAYTEDMCLWRALGRLGRRGANDVLMGIAYMPEELSPGVAMGEDGTRDFTVVDEQEAKLIGELLTLTDKHDLREFYKRVTSFEQWTPKLSAEFDAQLLRATTDSDIRPIGAPGNTGDPDLDGDAPHPDDESDREESVTAEVEPPVSPPRVFDATAMSSNEEIAPEIVSEGSDEWVDPDIAKHEAEVAAYEAKLASGEISRDDFPDAPMRADGAY